MAAVRIKICGLTRTEDVQLAARLGADALGFVFYPPSPRAVTLEQARVLAAATPPFVTRVGLFVNPSVAEVEQVLAQVPLELLQFHGDEPEAFCRQFGRPYIKALRMRPDLMPEQAAQAWPSAQGFLLDTYTPGLPGGTGASFDWQRFPSSQNCHWIVAGGLDAQNVAACIAQTRPYAVDVSGGVEQSRGIKCPTQLEAFIKAVRC